MSSPSFRTVRQLREVETTPSLEFEPGVGQPGAGDARRQAQIDILSANQELVRRRAVGIKTRQARRARGFGKTERMKRIGISAAAEERVAVDQRSPGRGAAQRHRRGESEFAVDRAGDRFNDLRRLRAGRGKDDVAALYEGIDVARARLDE